MFYPIYKFSESFSSACTNFYYISQNNGGGKGREVDYFNAATGDKIDDNFKKYEWQNILKCTAFSLFKKLVWTKDISK